MALDDQFSSNHQQLTDQARRVIRSTAELTQAFYILILVSAALSLPVLFVLIRAYNRIGSNLAMGRLVLFQVIMLGFNLWLSYHIYNYSKSLGELWKNPNQISMDGAILKQKNLWVFIGTMSCLITFSMMVRILSADIGTTTYTF